VIRGRSVGLGVAVLTLLAALVASLAFATAVRSRNGTDAATFDGSLASCALGEVLTPHRDADDWARTLLDTTFMLDPGFVPPDLVDVGEAGVPGNGLVRALAIDDLRSMHRAALRAGEAFGIESAYRSYDMQVRTFDSLQQAYGQDAALESAARPGHSEHQLGTTIDVDAGAESEAWLAVHAWQFGWVVSYPPAWSPGTTCYKPEPWHLRYIGREAARAEHAAGVSLRAWLWARQ
jgi:zinc D-Ala-D-Ala carboxypeptidase